MIVIVINLNRQGGGGNSVQPNTTPYSVQEARGRFKMDRRLPFLASLPQSSPLLHMASNVHELDMDNQHPSMGGGHGARKCIISDCLLCQSRSGATILFSSHQA